MAFDEVQAYINATAQDDPVAPLEAEDYQADDYDDYDDYDGHDSAFGGSILGSPTRSIDSSIMKFREENGRTYHAYKEGKYPLPNDESEKDRLDLQHHIYLLSYEGRLTLCKIPKKKQIHRVLDVGTGTGIWAIDYADEHPESHILGVDLSPIQPHFVPPNLSFEVCDLEEESWTFRYKFDFIHARMMTGSFADWPAFFKKSFDNLTPGGYIEVSDLTLPPLTDDDSYPEGSMLKKWGDIILEGSMKLGRPVNSAEQYKTQMIAAGFEDVVEVKFKWPSNRWPKDQKLKEIGMWNFENIGAEIEGLTMGFATRGLGWTADQVRAFAVDVRKEMRNTKIHAYFPIYTVYGKRPS